MANKPNILIIGDIMLDHYVSGKVARISPEAPVPVVKVDKEWSTLGGAANVAANVSALGAKAVLLGLVGADAAAKLIQKQCASKAIDAKLVEGPQPTIVKTRVVSGQQIVRFDREEEIVWSESLLSNFYQLVRALISETDIILLSDYAKGTLSDTVLNEIFATAKKLGKRVLVDPKRTDWSAYKGAFLATPNLAELALTQAGNPVANDDNTVVDVANSLRKQFEIQHIVTTRSSYGMTLASDQRILNIPTRAQEVFDVSGAGDTVLAAFGVSLAEGRSVSVSAFMANAAAGIVVSKLGTAVVLRSELESFLKANYKLIDRSSVSQFRKQHEQEKVVFTNGCFDVLHQGHRKLLLEAKNLGDKLVVAVNSDDSIKRLKGESRPVNGLNQRVEALAALPFVDAIIAFEEDTPFELLNEMRPNILVKGGDYRPDEVVGKDLVDEVVILPLIDGFSTTRLITHTM